MHVNKELKRVIADNINQFHEPLVCRRREHLSFNTYGIKSFAKKMNQSKRPCHLFIMILWVCGARRRFASAPRAKTDP